MTVLQTIAVALSMFSAIPMPQFEWTSRNMRSSLIAFPLIGIIIGLLVWGWVALCACLGWGSLLTGAGLVAIPVLVTGGIHLDGFCDTHDALASHAERERKLEIMKDSHTGAFAVIAMGVYLVVYLGFSCELTPGADTVLCLGGLYVMCRAASGFAIAALPCAKDSGLAHTFADMASRRTVEIGDASIVVIVAAALIVLTGIPGICVTVAVVVMFVIYRVSSARLFGGITGDLAGWFLQMAELLGIVALVIAQSL